MPPPLLLCLSPDDGLRETRYRVLLTRYAAVALSSVAAMQALAEVCTVDLLVLCHTLSGADCEAAVRVARTCWPAVKILGISAPYSNSIQARTDAVVSGLAGPYALFSAIATLLPPTLLLDGKSAKVASTPATASAATTVG